MLPIASANYLCIISLQYHFYKAEVIIVFFFVNQISKKKQKKMYQTKQNGEFDKAELILYEEVTRMPPFKRHTLALVGSQGVGRRTLKGRLINSDPEKFGSVIPCKYLPFHQFYFKLLLNNYTAK